MEKVLNNALLIFSRGAIVKCEEKSDSLYTQAYQMFPKDICNKIERDLDLKTTYIMGCTCRMGIYGNLTFRFRHSDDLTNRETLEAFIRHAGIALQRRYMREKLRKSEERIRVLERDSSAPGTPGARVVAHTKS